MKDQKEIKNIAASVKKRLRNIAVASGNDFSSVVEKIKLFIEPIFSLTEPKTWNPKEWKWI